MLGESPGLAFCELTVPPRFAGPPAHIHHDFDEAIYVLSGALTMTRGRPIPNPRPQAPSSWLPGASGTPSPTPPTSRSRSSGRGAQQARSSFMEEIGAALPASGPPDPTQLAEIYRRHNSELVP